MRSPRASVPGRPRAAPGGLAGARRSWVVGQPRSSSWRRRGRRTGPPSGGRPAAPVTGRSPWTCHSAACTRRPRRRCGTPCSSRSTRGEPGRATPRRAPRPEGARPREHHRGGCARPRHRGRECPRHRGGTLGRSRSSGRTTRRSRTRPCRSRTRAGLLECGPCSDGSGAHEAGRGRAIGRARRPIPPASTSCGSPPRTTVKARPWPTFATHDLHAESAASSSTRIAEPVRGRPVRGRVHGARVDGSSAPRTSSGRDPAGLLRRPPGEGERRGVVLLQRRPRVVPRDLRKAMVAADQGDVPLLGWDGMLDDRGTVSGSYLATAGDAAVGTYLSHASFVPPRAAFTEEVPGEPRRSARRIRWGGVHVCPGHPRWAPGGQRQRTRRRMGCGRRVRAAVASIPRRDETVLGTVGFRRERRLHAAVRVDPPGRPGRARWRGDWAVLKQQDFGSG